MVGDRGSARTLHLPPFASEIPKGWYWARLDEVCDGIFDCPHSTPKLTTDGPSLVRSQDMRSGIFKVHEAAHVSEETYMERVARAVPRHGDLFYSREGTYFGIAAEVPSNTRLCLGQRMVLIRPSPQVVQFRYLRFWLNSPLLAAYVYGFRDGTVAERLNLPTIRGLPIAVPPLAEQQMIARILGTLDDKIELNRRMNHSLEEMARAIFKSWFVDFDPVIAKSEGRQPYGMNAETAALFPSAFQDSELGPIPKGWGVGKVSDICTTQYGYTASASSEPIGPRFLRITDMNKEPWIDWQNVPYCAIDTQVLPRYSLQVGDVLVSRMADPGKAAIVDEELNAVFASYLVRLKTKSLASSHYLFYFLRSEQYLEYANGAMSGSVQSGMNAQVIVGAEMLLPPDSVVSAYLQAVQLLRKKIANNLQQSRTLAAIRDALLPKLLSGEIRVKDAADFQRISG